MTLEELTDYLFQIKLTGNKVGFTDQQLGKIQIIRIKDGQQVKTDMELELVKISGSGYVVIMREHSKGILLNG